MRAVHRFANLPDSPTLDRMIAATPMHLGAVDRWRRDLTNVQAERLERALADDLAFQDTLPRGAGNASRAT